MAVTVTVTMGCVAKNRATDCDGFVTKGWEGWGYEDRLSETELELEDERDSRGKGSRDRETEVETETKADGEGASEK